MADDEVDWGMEESVEVDEWRGNGVGEIEITADDEDVFDLGGEEDEVVKPASPLKPTARNGSPQIPTGPSKAPPTGPRKPSSVNMRSLGNIPTGPRSHSHERVPQTKISASVQGNDKEDDQTTKDKVAPLDSTNGDQAPLPEGWTEIMSKTHNRPFWFHQATNTTSWKRPTETTRPPTPPHPASDQVQNDSSLTVETKVTEAEPIATPALPVDPKSSRVPPTGPSIAPETVSINPETGRRNFVPLGYNPNKLASNDRRRPRSRSPGGGDGDARQSDLKRFKGEGERNSPLPPPGPRNDISERRPRSPVPGSIPQGPRDRRVSPSRGRPYDQARPNDRRPYGENRPQWDGPGYARGPNGATYDRRDFRPTGPRDTTRSDQTARIASYDETEARRAKLAEEKRLAEEKVKKLAEEDERLAREAKEAKAALEAKERKEKIAREEAEEKAKKDREEKAKREQEEKETREWRAKREEERRKEDEERARGEGEYRQRPDRNRPMRGPPRPSPPPSAKSYDAYRPGRPISPPPIPLAERISRRPDYAPRSPPRRLAPPPLRNFDADRGAGNGGSSYRPGDREPSPLRDRFRDFRDRDFRDVRDLRDGDRRPRGTFAEPMSAQAQLASRMRPESPPPFSRDARGPPPPRSGAGRPLAERMSRPPPGDNGYDGRDGREARDDRRGGLPPRRML